MARQRHLPTTGYFLKLLLYPFFTDGLTDPQRRKRGSADEYRAFEFALGVEYNAAGVRLPATMLGFAHPTLQRQLRKLQTAGVVRYQPAGRAVPAYDVQFNHE